MYPDADTHRPFGKERSQIVLGLPAEYRQPFFFTGTIQSAVNLQNRTLAHRHTLMQWSTIFPGTPWPALRWLWLFLLISAGKLAWLWFDGVHVHPDSLNYLTTTWHNDYPPLYPLFVRFTTSMSDGLGFTAACQAILFALCALVLVRTLASTKKEAWIYAAVLAVEPMSGFLMTSIMSEGVFLPLLLVWLAGALLLPRVKFAWWLVLSMGALSGVMYGFRFAMFFPVLFLVIVWLRDYSAGRRRIWQVLGFLIAFQVILLPLRLKHHETFASYQLNHFTGANLWNNSAFLYPDSDLRQYPGNAFDVYLNHYPDSAFDAYRSARSQHIWDATAPYRQYADSTYRFEERWQASRLAGETGKHLIFNHPIDYLAGFVWPNVAKLYTDSERIDVHGHAPWLEDEYGLTDNIVFSYRPRYWWGLSIVLLLVSLQLLFRPKLRTRRMLFLLALLWWCSLVIPLIAPVNLRYYYTLAPLFWILVAQVTFAASPPKIK